MQEQQCYWDVVNATKMGQYLTAMELGFVTEFLQNKNVSLVLDVGGGSGRIAIPVYKKLRNQVVVFDKGLLQLGKLRAKADCAVCLGNTDSWPFKDECFDALLAIQLVEYLLDIHVFFRECQRVLKPGGYLLFNFSNEHSLYGWLHPVLYKNKTCYRFSFSDIKQSAKNAGFNIVKANGYRWLPFTRASNNKALDFFATLERWLKPLTAEPRISPWVFCIAKKCD